MSGEMNKNMDIMETSSIYCSGFRFPEDCSNNGVYIEDSKECQECNADAMKALNEAFEEFNPF